MKATPAGRPFVETVRELSGELAGQVADAGKIRLLCPRGHFVIDLAVITLSDGLVLTAPLDGIDEHDFALGFSEIVAGARLRPPRRASGILRQSGDRIGTYDRGELSVACPRKKCDSRRGRSYSGSFDYYSFSAEVGTSAEMGHTEHRLTD